uniref:Peptidase S1 domain-containing protein n=1 Tax=Sinocyclocheilus grahami TaxID=75366 RepID=A0A672RV79_SINGR
MPICTSADVTGENSDCEEHKPVYQLCLDDCLLTLSLSLSLSLSVHTGSLCQLDVCGRAPLRDRIVGGENATAKQTFSIYSFVLSRVVIYFGRLSQSGSNPNETNRTVSRIINHPKYGSPPYDNDIALIQLSSSVNFSEYIRSVCLAAAGSVFGGGTESWVTGWGRLQQEASNILQEVMMTVVSNRICNIFYRGSITSNMICAGQKRKSACPGDSGGPMVIRNGSLWIQSGIANFIRGSCADPKYPNGFARVSKHQNWIKSYTGSKQPGFVAFNAASSNFRSVPNLILFPLSLTLSIIPFTFSLCLAS